MSSSIQVQVAIGDDFLLAFSQLPKGTQKKARDFLEKFRSNPMSTGLNYEPIHQARDPNLRSLRVDQNYRAIVHKPDNGKTFILLWMDKHDEAYAWACRKVCSIHPNTGAIQVFQSQEGVVEEKEPAQVPVPTPPKPKRSGMFDPFKDSELVELGVPAVSLDEIRKIQTNEELDELESDLPADAFEALYYLAVGGTLEETRRELGIEAPEEVDVEDFAGALKRDSAMRKFIVIADNEEMEKILAYPLDRWRIFLHPSQRKLVEMNARGPVRVLGGAGTGKTVVAIHRAKHLAEKLCTKDEKVLITTFTKNLASNIEGNLKKICSLETLQKIEVKNLDAWANQLLVGRSARSRRVDFKGDDLKECWEAALTEAPTDSPLDAQGLEREWKYVIQAQGIRDLATYIRATRIGMGGMLSRSNRKKVWPVFEEYIALQKEKGICEPIEALKMARDLIEEQKLVLDYRAVVIDEAQDLSAEAFRLANAIVPKVRAEDGNNLFIVGDAHQRLYGHRVVLSHCGIDIRGRGKRLRINYRTSEETRNWATSILKDCPIDDLDGGKDTLKGYRSLFHSEEPVVVECEDLKEHNEAIHGHIQNLLEQGAEEGTICIVAKSNQKVDDLKEYLENKGVTCRKVTRAELDNVNFPGVRLATMHRVKGIEFDHMVLAYMDQGTWVSKDGKLSVENRSLLYVASTRARKSVYVCSPGKLVPEIPIVK